jgi:hypothetical protein
MTSILDAGPHARPKLIHSNVCFLAVPAGLCVAAVLIHWLMTMV